LVEGVPEGLWVFVGGDRIAEDGHIVIQLLQEADVLGE
jgi:hypothetical protein